MRFAACALTLGIFTSVASAQQMATAEWFVRQQGDTVQAAIEIEVKPDWYLYHTNKGSKNAPAKPLVISWNGDAGITWQAPILPKPKVGRGGEEWGDPFTYNYHVGSITVWVQGTGATSVDSLRLNLDGQTCSDVEGSCVEFMVKDLAPAAGNGPWDKVPAAFATQAAPAPEVEKAPGKTGGSGGFGFNAGQGFELPKENKPNSFGWKPEYKNHVDARLRVLRAGEEVQAIFEIDVAEGYHAYHGPTQDDIAPGKPVAEPTRVELDEVEVLWQKPVYSEPHIGEGLNDAGDDIAIRTHEREWTIHVAGTADGEVELEDLVFVLKGQVCDDAGCQQFSFELTPEVEDVDSLPPMPAAVDVALDGAVADGAGEQKKEDGLWVFLGQAVFWALFTLLMPCTYPMIPITISFFTKQATSRGGSVLPLALTYGAGIVSIFILIGLLFGQVIGAFAAHPVTNSVIGIVFIYFADPVRLDNLQPPQALNCMARGES
ncbi:MAG: protein-disulfide reductase DsbD family protein [Planctomycetota bacterium]